MVTRTSTKDGNWSDATVWGGTVPLDGDTVNVNHNIVFDVNQSAMPSGINSITIASKKVLSFRPDIVTYLRCSSGNIIGASDGTAGLIVGGYNTVTGFTLTTGKTYTYQKSITSNIVSVFENGIFDPDTYDILNYDSVTSINAVESTTNSFYYDPVGEILYIHTSDSTNPSGKTITTATPINRPAVGSSVQCTLYLGAITSFSYFFLNLNPFIFGYNPQTVNNSFLSANVSAGATVLPPLTDDLKLQQGDMIVLGCGNQVGRMQDQSPFTETNNGIYTVSSYNATTKTVTLSSPLLTGRLSGDAVAIYNRSIDFICAVMQNQNELNPVLYHLEGCRLKSVMPLLYAGNGFHRFNTFVSCVPNYLMTGSGNLTDSTICTDGSGNAYFAQGGWVTFGKRLAIINGYMMFYFTNQSRIFDSVIQNMWELVGSSSDLKIVNSKIMNCNSMGFLGTNFKIINCTLSNTPLDLWLGFVEMYNEDGSVTLIQANGTATFADDILTFNLEQQSVLPIPLIYDVPFLSPANKNLTFSAIFNKDFSGGDVELQIIDPLNDPVDMDYYMNESCNYTTGREDWNEINENYTPLNSAIMPDIENQNITLNIGYKSNITKNLILRISVIAPDSGTVTVDISKIVNRSAKPPLIIRGVSSL